MKMLAVLNQQALVKKNMERKNKGKMQADEASEFGLAELVKDFSSVNEDAVTISLGSSGWLCYAAEKQNTLHVPRLFAAVDGIFCWFQGHLVNVPDLKQRYGLSKTANDVITVIEVYKALRDQKGGPYPAAGQVVKDVRGNFSFVLFDCSSKWFFIACDPDGSGGPIFMGTDSKGDYAVVCTDADIMKKKGLGKSIQPFPKGFSYTSSNGWKVFFSTTYPKG